MEIQTSPLDHDDEQKPSAAAATIYDSNVDTSRPFRSVKEAVAIFGERFLAGEIYAPKPFAFPTQETPCFYTPSPSPQKSQEFASWRSIDSNDHNHAETIKKLESELEDTKMELKKLKERESETEVALASLNAELHKNMSKLAQAEAAAASKALMVSRSAAPDRNTDHHQRQDGISEENRRRDLIVKLESSPTLAQMLNTAADKEGWFEANFKKERKMKKKPIIPLVGDLFSRKKGSSTSMLNPLYASSHLRLN